MRRKIDIPAACAIGLCLLNIPRQLESTQEESFGDFTNMRLPSCMTDTSDLSREKRPESPQGNFRRDNQATQIQTLKTQFIGFTPAYNPG